MSAKKTNKIVTPTSEESEQFGVASADGSASAADAQDPEVDWKDKFLRAKAELQNVQRRAAEEQRTAVRFANANLLRALLEVIDDFERTLEAETADSAEPLRTGVKLVYDKLHKLLRDGHVEVIQAVGQPFDPQQHEALMQQPSAADHPPNTVLQEIQKGYRCHERVLRPARVIVSQDPNSIADDPAVDVEA